MTTRLKSTNSLLRFWRRLEVRKMCWNNWRKKIKSDAFLFLFLWKLHQPVIQFWKVAHPEQGEVALESRLGDWFVFLEEGQRDDEESVGLGVEGSLVVGDALLAKNDLKLALGTGRRKEKGSCILAMNNLSLNTATQTEAAQFVSDAVIGPIQSNAATTKSNRYGSSTFCPCYSLLSHKNH